MKRSKHNLSNTQLITGKFGQLIPCGLTEVLPGDTFQHSTSAFARILPLESPVMHRTHMEIHHWFVPHRLIWSSFENFITGGPDGTDASVFPTIALSAVTKNSLADYLGIPPGFTGSVSALPFRAYALIFNEWYRDQDLVTALGLSTADGADLTTNTTLQYRSWEKDYFTTSRPWTQKGTGLTLPLGSSAPVSFQENGTTPQALTLSRNTGSAGTYVLANEAGTAADTITGIADLSAATGVDINTVRLYFAQQRYMEARARYGSRFTEYLAYLGVRAQDARLQRPEYLGGGRQVLSFSEVLQTASTTAAANGVGQLYGHGIASMRSNAYRKFFPEHGYVLSFVSVLPETMYPDGIFRTWNRRTKEDFFQKELQHIGQQPVLMKEVYALGSNPDTTFSYQDRYDEYRFQESRVHGDFYDTMQSWHFARLLGAEPALNSAFVTASSVPTAPFQDTSGSQFALHARHHLGARRIIAQKGSSFIL